MASSGFNLADPSSASGYSFSGTASDPFAAGPGAFAGGAFGNPAAGGSSGGGIVGSLGSFLGFTDNPPPSMFDMGSLASYEAGQGQQLQGYLSSGTLPPALQAKLDLSEKAAEASRLQAAATMGGPADPTRNTPLGQDLSSLRMQEVAAAGDIETKLYQAGTQELGQSADLLKSITGFDLKMQEDQSKALAGFASAISSLFGPVMKTALGAATGGASLPFTAALDQTQTVDDGSGNSTGFDTNPWSAGGMFG